MTITAQRPDLFQAASDGKDLTAFRDLTEDEGIDSYKDKDGNTLLSIAARNGHKHLVNLLREKGASIFETNSNHKTPLFYAAVNGHKEIVDFLIARERYFYGKTVGRTVSEAVVSATAGGQSSLLRHLLDRYKHLTNLSQHEVQNNFNRAAAAGHTEVMELWYRNFDVDINGTDDSGNTALYRASQACHKDVVAVLLGKERIDINAWSSDGSALSAALGSGYEDLAEMLYAKDKTGRGKRHTALHDAASKDDTETVKWLLTKDGVDVNAKDAKNKTSLHTASLNGHTKTAKLLFGRCDILINATTHENETPLHMAAGTDRTEIVKLFLERNDLIINAENAHNETPLHMAAKYGGPETVKLLLAAKEINVNTQNWENKTPLHTAVNNGFTEIVRLLLESDGVKDCNVTYLLCDAAEKGHTETARLLLSRNEININVEVEGRTPLHRAAARGDIKMVKLLLETNEINVNAISRDAETPLYSALRSSHHDVIALLLERDDLDLEADEFRSGKLIHWAADNGHHNLMDLVLVKECNAYPNRNQLTWSSERGYLKALECLLERDGIDVNSKDGDGRTPLSRAAEKGHGKVVEVLLRYSTDGNLKDDDGRTPLSWAARNEHEEVVKQLVPFDTAALLILTKEGNKRAIDFLLLHKPTLEQNKRSRSNCPTSCGTIGVSGHCKSSDVERSKRQLQR